MAFTIYRHTLKNYQLMLIKMYWMMAYEKWLIFFIKVFWLALSVRLS